MKDTSGNIIFYARCEDGHGYYHNAGLDLMAAPLNRDGTLDLECEMYVCDFAFPLTDHELVEINVALGEIESTFIQGKEM